jgi:hypothetical protein
VHPLRPRRGRFLQCRVPVWGPLFELAPAHVGEFMWMYEIELEGGCRLHAYKHHRTRRYLHLDHGGRAFVFVWKESQAEEEPSEYEEVDPQWLLDLALERPEERARLFRQNISAEFKRIRWARSATKHRISKKRIRHALEHCLAILEQDPPEGARLESELRLVFLGEDAAGFPLEAIAVETERESLMVIHAMELRPRYRSTYREVRRCNR